MKIKTKIVTTLIVGIALFTGTIGVASASPHYSDWSSTRVIEKSAQAVRIDHPTIKRSAILYTPSFKTTMINSHGEEASDRAQAPKNVVRVTPRPQLPDETVCLSNIKVWELQNTGPSLHDSIHCLHGGERKEHDRTSSFFSMGLHNDGTFLPLHRSFFMTIR